MRKVGGGGRGGGGGGGGDGGGEFSSRMNFSLKNIYFLFRPPTPPTHNFSNVLP